MPRHAAEPIRRAAIVKATIQEVARAGSLEVTVAQIAARAGVSSALAHHYFGSKEAIFVAAMRHVLTLFGAEVRGALATADSPRSRIEAIVRASFSAGSFRREVIAAWLNFYVQAQTTPEARRLLSLYRKRLHSNLVHSLKPLVGDRAGEVAEGVGALIDGVYLRQALAGTTPDRRAAADLVLNHVIREIGA
ncbi:transcriptional regulator BetI [Rubellimicrobium rubrum]|uniref:HTH-type transcriptional regulator BetI n=1 Tax=Rubellimicrobium rubrum TaxID=2585369 RepID=A0A5C4N666_9RHOB|nr:transcriptional regulator BetI [Rubellimicrobium rubrum]TNC51861.1 transcriptional regulator BetI [Rubellimicrobium rubrum]